MVRHFYRGSQAHVILSEIQCLDIEKNFYEGVGGPTLLVRARGVHHRYFYYDPLLLDIGGFYTKSKNL